MEGASVVILLVGMVFPITLLLLALVADVIAVLWALYIMWREDWSEGLWQVLKRFGHVPHWQWHWHTVRR